MPWFHAPVLTVPFFVLVSVRNGVSWYTLKKGQLRLQRKPNGRYPVDTAEIIAAGRAVMYAYVSTRPKSEIPGETS